MIFEWQGGINQEKLSTGIRTIKGKIGYSTHWIIEFGYFFGVGVFYEIVFLLANI